MLQHPRTRTGLRRSRNGCYTCRLRKKKCDEESPCCKACTGLGLGCGYERPVWWSDNDQRQHQKDEIKKIINPKNMTEKALEITTNSIDRAQSGPKPGPAIVDYKAFNVQIHSWHEYTPYEADVKTKRPTHAKEGLTRRESTVSTYSTYHAPSYTVLPSLPIEGGKFVQEIYSEHKESFSEEALNMNLFDFSRSPAAASGQIAIELDQNDQLLLDHFVQFVLPSAFPILETYKPGSAQTDLIVPALVKNRHYLRYCLSVAAQHYQTTMNVQYEQIAYNMMRHRYAAISINGDEDYQQLLDARLAMIFFQCLVNGNDDSRLEMPWYQHFEAVASLVQTLELPRLVTDPDEQSKPTPFNMTLTAWIDILSATIHGRAPIFAHTYREKHLSSSNCSLGLRELMGCEDKVMYLISEIACLDALKRNGIDDIQLYHHIHSLSDQIGLTEVSKTGPKAPYNADGILNPDQLSKNITTTFCLAARIYLCSLVPGFSHSQASCIGLVSKLASALEFIPSGPDGFDRSLVWVYLIGGSVSLFWSPFRTLFSDRIIGLGHLAETGSFGRVVYLLREVWSHVDRQTAPGGLEALYISPGNVMQMKGWDFLLM